MDNESKIKKLKIFLQVYGVLTLLIFGVLSIAFIFQLQEFNPGGKYNWLIWDDVYGHVGPMLVIIYLVWGVYFFVAANDPMKYRTFLDFTMWANASHGLLPETDTITEVYGLHAEGTGMPSNKEFQGLMESMTLLKRLPKLSELANVATFMASDYASAMTGTTVNISCGSVVD